MKTFTPKGNTVGMIMPTFIMQTKLSHGAKLLYALLCDFAGNKDYCWPSQARLAQKLFCSISSIKRYLAELAKSKFVHIQHNSQKSSMYFMLAISNKHNKAQVKLSYQNKNHKPKMNQSHDVKLSDQKTNSNRKRNIIDGVNLNGHGVNLNGQQSKLNYESNLNNLILRTIPPKSPTTSSTSDVVLAQKKQRVRAFSFENIDTDFETFWTQYPKKEAKAMAKRIWHNMAKANELADLKPMSLSLQYFCKTEGWQRENKRYVPQLGNWLKDKRWQDIDQSELDNLAKELAQESAILAQTKAILASKQPFLSNKNTDKDSAEVSKHKALFEKFAVNFTIPSQGIKSMAFGLWSFLHQKNIAPQVIEKQEDSIVSYLKDYKISMLCCA